MWQELWRAQLAFLKGVRAMPLVWQAWLMLLFVVNMLVPLLFWRRPEAQLALGVMLLNLVLMIVLTAATGFSRLLGLGHFPWFILIALLWPRLAEIGAGSVYGLWLRAVVALNAVSLAIDMTDVARYLRGERGPTVNP